jgi:hypothetical protein
MAEQLLEIYREDDASFDVAVTNPAGAAQSLAGCYLTFTAKAAPADAVATIRKTSPAGGIVITNAAGGLARIDLLPADTTAFRYTTFLVWELLLVDAAGKNHTLAQGRLVITANLA